MDTDSRFTKAFDFAKLTGSTAIPLQFRFLFDDDTNQSAIIEYDPLSEDFSITKRGQFFNGNTYKTKDPAAAINIVHIMKHLDTNTYKDVISKLITIFGHNPGQLITQLGTEIVKDSLLLRTLEDDEHLRKVLTIDNEFINYGI
jgi:hypothetical protein